ncbi:uncharacterized protein LOC114213779 isoform X1 [Eumetopias jubatus]|uniref:uncharacterized protein LOC114213779 isoform X1 n=1 Tax=Eumetopias jubatus TaxID=34886 RepID=UPI001016AE25|nr:uncharacterized protein LOC114213779 isoform X1 [Eumetopias jubatus]
MGRIRVGGWGEGARFPSRHFLVWTVGDSKARLWRGLKPGTRTCWGKHKGADKKGVGRPAGATTWSGLVPRESESRAAGDGYELHPERLKSDSKSFPSIHWPQSRYHGLRKAPLRPSRLVKCAPSRHSHSIPTTLSVLWSVLRTSVSPRNCVQLLAQSLPRESLVTAGLSQDLPRPPFLPACLPARLETLQLETQVAVGEAAGLFAPEPAEKSQQSMANNTAGGCGIDLPSPGWQPGGS